MNQNAGSSVDLDRKQRDKPAQVGSNNAIALALYTIVNAPAGAADCINVRMHSSDKRLHM